MIVKMKKVQIVVREADRGPLLDALHEIGVLHITPVHPDHAVPDETISVSLDNLRRAIQALASVEPAGAAPTGLSSQDAAEEVLEIQRRLSEHDAKLNALYRELEQQAIWGEVTTDDLRALSAAGVEPAFYVLPAQQAGQIQAECTAMLRGVDKDKVIAAVVDRNGEAEIPEGAELIPWPRRDNAAIRAEAADIEARRARRMKRLSELAQLLPRIEARKRKLEERAEFSAADRGGLHDPYLFAVEGWVPADQVDSLEKDLWARGIPAAARALDPEEEETPPTLIRYPKWAVPIKGLFDMLGTFPGYRELDLAPFFMIAMPIFSAMLAGDAGYGLLFLIPCLLFYGRIKAKVGAEGTQLLIIFGAATFIWGLLSANFFGVKPEGLAEMMPLERESDEATQWLLIKISFIIGSVHLITAHVRKALALLPDSRAVADIGWSLALAGMLGVIWYMVFDGCPVPSLVWLSGLAVGLVLAITFASPHRNPLKRIGIGFASSLLPLISTFSDTMSYIRLMAVGMASYYIAYAFNDLGSTIAETGTWAAAAPILVFGHALNIILILIAIFAHGVRLNMLEFSNNAGVEWAGYPYSPFRKT